MEETFKTLPKHTLNWSKGKLTFYKYEGFWSIKKYLEEVILAQQSFKARPTDVLLCSCPKTGTTWLKALAFAIVTRDKFNESTTPLLTTLPHDCLPILEKTLDRIEDNSCFPLMSTHIPYTSLPESVLSSNCKIVYIYRNVKDVIVSQEISKLAIEDAPFEEAFDEFCQGVSFYGPYWDHILGYWKASLERPDTILFLKYEDLKMDPVSNVKRLAEFIGYPFSIQETNAGVVEKIIQLCSFENLSKLEVNKSENLPAKDFVVENQFFFFRKAKDGDWENYFTDDMKEKVDKLIDQELSSTGLVLK
ncbi:flavonol 4'-sulfotransferase [Artemisia annua]|uniref:Sulfotransferase n=1 Tax=Artemisia annua TaxID=35608 RepID=A0A2U1QLB1_ARTAN|nr:flavonol 4'-sulfotransferase [Artemisia annua]